MVRWPLLHGRAFRPSRDRLAERVEIDYPFPNGKRLGDRQRRGAPGKMLLIAAVEKVSSRRPICLKLGSIVNLCNKRCNGEIIPVQ